MGGSRQTTPDWDRLYQAALAEEGHFPTQQALDAGYSSQLLVKYLDSGKIIRVRRSVYRLKHFPPGQQEDLVALWLWSDRAGVFSHETALMLHELSDVLPARAHLTLPAKRSEEHTSELQSQSNIVCRLLLEKKKKKNGNYGSSVYMRTHVGC